MKIQWLVEDVWVSDKSYLFSISHNIISFFVINLLYGADRPSTWSNLLGSGGTGICLINSIDLISHIEDHEPIGLFVHQHDIVTKFQLPIMAIRLGNSLEGLGKFLLGLANHQSTLVLLVQVIPLVVLSEVKFFRPISYSSLAGVFRAT